MSINWSALQRAVETHQRFLLTSHQRPDCDALGSELGMAAILAACGKEVVIVNPDPVPEHLKFLDPTERIRSVAEVEQATLDAAQVLIVLDTSAWVQLGAMADVVRASQAERLVVDHHVSEDDLGAVNLKNPQAEATGRLVVEAADALGVPLSAEMADPLYAAIATDTGWFRFASVTDKTYATVARLVAAGAKPQAIYRNLYEQETPARVRLRGQILRGLQAELGGRLVYSQAVTADFTECGAQPGDTEEVINHLMRVAHCEVALLFVELGPDRVKTSFRSRGKIDVRAIAEQFGGGGHILASGATCAGTFDEVRTKILDTVRASMA